MLLGNLFDGKFLHHLVTRSRSQFFPVLVRLEYPENSTRKIHGFKGMGKIAILFMVDQVRDSSLAECHAWSAAGHGFHNRIRQILLKGWQDENIGCGIEKSEGSIDVLPPQVMDLEPDVRRRLRLGRTENNEFNPIPPLASGNFM